MSRKDYVAIAEAIRVEYDGFAGHQAQRFALESMASRIATALKQDNPRFDRQRFLTAALGEEFGK